MSSSSKPFLIKIAIGVYILSIVVLIGSYFAISTKQIQSALYVQSNDWVPEKENLMRGVFLNVPTGRTYNSGSATLVMDNESRSENIPLDGFFHIKATPTSHSRNARLDLSSGVDRLSSEFSFELMKEIPKLGNPLRRSKEEQKQKVIAEWKGEDTLKMIPSTGEIARGLRDEIYFITRRKGIPTSMKVEILSHEGGVKNLPHYIQSDAFGIVKLELNATTSFRLSMKIVHEESISEGKVNVFTIPSQFSTRLERIFVPHAKMIQGFSTSVRQSGALLVDGYEKGRWASAGVFGLNKQGAGFEIPASKSGQLMRVQIYHDFYKPGKAWNVKWVAIGDKKLEGEYCELFQSLVRSRKTKSSQKWADEILALPQYSKASFHQCKTFLSAYLADLPIDFVKPDTLVNSREDLIGELNSWKEDKKNNLKIITAIVLIGGFCFILWLVLLGVRKQRGLRHAIESISDEDERSFHEDPFEAFLHYLRIVIILTALATFIASIMMVMSFM